MPSLGSCGTTCDVITQYSNLGIAPPEILEVDHIDCLDEADVYSCVEDTSLGEEYWDETTAKALLVKIRMVL